MENKKQLVYVGSWGNRENQGHGEGISVCTVDPTDGSLDLLQTLELEEPSVVSVSPDGRFLYAVNELCNGFDGEPGMGGGVSAMRILGDGRLELINKTPSLGSIPCYLETDPRGEYVIAAIHSGFGLTTRFVKTQEGFAAVRSYDQSALALFRVREDGGLAPADLLPFTEPGSAVYYRRDHQKIERGYPGKPPVDKAFLQSHSFIHCVAFLSDDLFLATDRGTDMVHLCELDREYGVLRRVHTCRVDLGQAPRHLTVHPTKPYIYMTNEVESSVTVFEFDLEKKSFWRVQTTGVSKDQPMDAIIMPCDIHIHPSGRFLYLTNRGLNDLVVYDVDQDSGKLSMKQIYPMNRAEPRGFYLTDDGRYLVIGSKDTDEMETLTVAEDGQVSATGHRGHVNTPCCVRILKR